MADANINKAVLLLKAKEIEIIAPDDRLGFRAGEVGIEILPSYNMAGGDLAAMQVPAYEVIVPKGGTYEDYIKAVLATLAAAKQAA